MPVFFPACLPAMCGVKPRPSWMLGQCSTSELHAQPKCVSHMCKQAQVKDSGHSPGFWKRVELVLVCKWDWEPQLGAGTQVNKDAFSAGSHQTRVAPREREEKPRHGAFLSFSYKSLGFCLVQVSCPDVQNQYFLHKYCFLHKKKRCTHLPEQEVKPI